MTTRSWAAVAAAARPRQQPIVPPPLVPPPPLVLPPPLPQQAPPLPQPLELPLQQTQTDSDGTRTAPLNAVAAQEAAALAAIFGDEHVRINPSAATVAVRVTAPLANHNPNPNPQLLQLQQHGPAVWLFATFSPSYPAAVPALDIRCLAGIDASLAASIRSRIRSAAAALVGQEMIYEITLLIQDILADLVSPPVNPSSSSHTAAAGATADAATTNPHASSYDRMQVRLRLDDQRRTAQYQQEVELQQRLADSRLHEDQAKLAQQVLLERERKEELLKQDRARRRRRPAPNESPEARPITGPSDAPKGTQHQHVAQLVMPIPSSHSSHPSPRRHSFALSDVIFKSLIYRRGRTTIYAVHLKESTSPSSAATSPSKPSTHAAILRLKTFHIHQCHLAATPVVDSLDACLKNASHISAPGILPFYDFSIIQTPPSPSDSSITITIELLLASCHGPTLLETLRSAGAIELPRARKHAISILETVHALHSADTVHQGITTKTVFFDPEGRVCLSGHIFEYQLVKLANLEGTSNHNRSSAWECPDFVTGNITPKTDVWMIGLLLLEMLLGEAVASAASLHGILASKNKVPVSLGILLSRMMNQDPDSRPSVSEVLDHPFFSEDPPSLSPFSPLTLNHATIRHPLPSKSMAPDHASASIFGTDSDSLRRSRYYSDFEELEFLGKGGFGQVVKARNRLDGAIYAIKRVRINPRDRERSDRLLREVQTLSRLHNEYVVRYYQAWIEHVSDPHEADGVLSLESLGEETEEFSDHTDDDDDDDDDEGRNGLPANFRDDWLDSKEPSISFIRGPRHTSSDTSGSLSDAGDTLPTGRHSRASERLILLYIQMEYCEKQTLRDVIDAGLDENEAWRLFRQLLEGLGHIHSQGIIHRDLKPSNVFMDAHRNVKLGDFGLATARRDAAVFQSRAGLVSEDLFLFEDSSLTNDVGTPIYVAPEILLKSGRYNTKVDMYSLGIVFFEMVYPFNTGMQRALVLRDLRQNSVVFPPDFDQQRLSAQEEIIQKLLSHVPKERPSCAQLLQSPLVPTRVEEEYINEELLRIVRQNNPAYFLRLITSLFGQRVDRHKDLVYDFHSIQPVFDVRNAAIASHVERHAVGIFVRHGAVPVSLPLLIPKTQEVANIYAGRRPTELIDSGGNVVQLRYDLVTPFARMVASMAQLDPLPFKRYNIERVYRSNVTGGQPRTVMESDFDIVSYKSTRMLAEAEVIKAACEVLDFELMGGEARVGSELHIRLNHVEILPCVLEHCGVPSDKRHAVSELLEQLGHPLTLVQLRGHLLELGLTKAIVERLLGFSEGIEFGKEKSFPAGLDTIPAFQKAYALLTTLHANLRALNTRHRVIFEPILVFSSTIYASGILFQIGHRRPKRFDVFAAGGNYDRLLHAFRGPFSSSINDISAVGASIALSKIISGISTAVATSTPRHSVEDIKHSHLSLARADVLVASFAKSGANLHENLAVAADLWNAGISADLSYDGYVSSQEDIQRAWKDGYRAIVILKQRGQDASSGSLIKVRGFLSRHETEVSRSEVVAALQQELSISTIRQPNSLINNDKSQSSTTTASSTSRATCIVAHAFRRGKGKSRERSGMESRAISAAARAGTNAHVLAVELTQAELARLRPVWFSDDESFKRALQVAGMNHVKEYTLQIRRHLQKSRREALSNRSGDSPHFIWIFSDPDGSAFPIPFLDQ